MGRKKIVKEYYFDVNEEKAVLDYIKTDSREVKYRLYTTYLEKPFQVMIESILRRYPNHIGNYEIHDLEMNALSHLIEQMVNYKPYSIKYRVISDYMTDDDWKTCGKYMEESEMDLEYDNFLNERDSHLYEYKKFTNKAYSYCQTIIRNYYKDHSKKSRQEILLNHNFDDFSHEIDKLDDYQYELDAHVHDFSFEYVKRIIDLIKDRLKEPETILKENEIIVGEAIIEILSNWELLFQEDNFLNDNTKRITNNYKKNKILLLLQEYTKLKTKDIRLAMKPYKELYNFMKEDYLKNN